MRIQATILQTPAPGTLQVLEEHVVTVDDDGWITTLEPAGHVPDAGPDGAGVDVRLPAGVVLIPGLVDTHLHAPQWPQLGTGLDLPLEEWLMVHTFPLEARFADVAFARRVWDDMVPSLLANGTTTAVYYGSIHEPATVDLAAACLTYGQRALVGRVAMDHPDTTPEWYRDPGARAGVEASARSIEAIRALAGGGPGGAGRDGGQVLVRPIITPRFIPACSDALLHGLGELAAETGVTIQTHCSESDWEHADVFDRCRRSDAAALERFGLIGPHTVLAHATHVDDDDRALVASAGAGVAHCPLSNVYFSERIFAVRAALAAGLRVGLGTDIAGGPEPSVLAQCGHAVGVSRQLSRSTESAVAVGNAGPVSSVGIDMTTAFWLATAGGAELTGLPVGLLEPGRAFDAVAVNLGSGGLGLWNEAGDWPPLFEKLVRLSGPAHMTDVWVAGRRVAGTGPD
ncbi:MAG: amidohydrolase family protein [Acidimicrobiia bacterium]|nr:amidohydrolase family protein [Acidimicrobiia bacterium]